MLQCSRISLATGNGARMDSSSTVEPASSHGRGSRATKWACNSLSSASAARKMVDDDNNKHLASDILSQPSWD